jgi:hypothetical protein
MHQISSNRQWREFERTSWLQAVRDRGLRLRSLDEDERALVFEAINQDLERRKGSLLGR